MSLQPETRTKRKIYTGCKRPLMPFAQRKETTCRKSDDLKPKECCARRGTGSGSDHPDPGFAHPNGPVSVLVGMATMNRLVYSIAGLLEQVHCEMSFRYHLKKIDMAKLEQKNTPILAHSMHHYPETRERVSVRDRLH